jgi:hypothetical protein
MIPDYIKTEMALIRSVMKLAPRSRSLPAQPVAAYHEKVSLIYGIQRLRYYVDAGYLATGTYGIVGIVSDEKVKLLDVDFSVPDPYRFWASWIRIRNYLCGSVSGSFH